MKKQEKSINMIFWMDIIAGQKILFEPFRDSPFSFMPSDNERSLPSMQSDFTGLLVRSAHVMYYSDNPHSYGIFHEWLLCTQFEFKGDPLICFPAIEPPPPVSYLYGGGIFAGDGTISYCKDYKSPANPCALPIPAFIPMASIGSDDSIMLRCQNEEVHRRMVKLFDKAEANQSTYLLRIFVEGDVLFKKPKSLFAKILSKLGISK